MESLSRFGQHLFDVARRLGFVEYEAGERQKTFALRERLVLSLVFLFVSASSTATGVLFVLFIAPKRTAPRPWESPEEVAAYLEPTLVLSIVGMSVYLFANAFAQIFGLLLSTSLKGDKLTKLRPLSLVSVIAAMIFLTWYFFLADWEIVKIVYALLTIGVSLIIFIVTAHIGLSKSE
jgi:hypothetical protein